MLLTLMGLLGVLAGLVGAALTLFIELLTEHAAHTPPVLYPALAGVLAGVLWLLIRRGDRLKTVQQALVTPTRMPLARTILDALTQVFLVGMGASVGREQAPRQIAAAIADRFTPWLDELWRQRLIAASAGAGLAAVYNTPLAGILFTWEVLPLRRDRYLVLASTITSVLGAWVARPVVGAGAFYPFPSTHWELSAFLICLVVMVCSPITGWLFRYLVERRFSLPLWALPLSVGATMALMGVISIRFPDIAGNGQLILEATYLSSPQVQLLLSLFLLKILATWLCLAMGAAGGILTPSLAIGATQATLIAFALYALLPNEPSAGLLHSVALIGGIGVLALTQRAPLFAVVFALELTHPALWLYPIAALAGLVALSITAFNRH